MVFTRQTAPEPTLTELSTQRLGPCSLGSLRHCHCWTAIERRSVLGLGVSGTLRPREFKGLAETWGMGTALAKVRSVVPKVTLVCSSPSG